MKTNEREAILVLLVIAATTSAPPFTPDASGAVRAPSAGRQQSASTSGQGTIDERRPAPARGTVKITNNAGSVRVSGWQRDTVAITGALGPEIERLSFETGEGATRIRVVVKREFQDQLLEGSDLVIRVPRESHVAVRTASGDIEVADVYNGVDLESVEGDISVRGSLYSIHAQTAGGDIVIDALRKGSLHVSSVGGDITIRGASGYVDVSTVSGDARVWGRRVWEGRITSVSGDIRFEGDFEPDGAFYFESNSGGIELALPVNIAADFDITTFAGSLESEFEGATDPISTGSGQEHSFSIGGPGTRVKIRTFKGKVRLLKR